MSKIICNRARKRRKKIICKKEKDRRKSWIPVEPYQPYAEYTLATYAVILSTSLATYAVIPSIAQLFALHVTKRNIIET